MSYIPTLLHAIENRLDETTTEIGHLEAALSALTTSTTTTAEARPGKSRTTRQRRRASTMRTGTPLDSETAAVTAAPEPAEPITNTIDPDPSRPVEPKPTAAAPDSTRPERSDPIANDAAPTARRPRRRPGAAGASRRRRGTAKLNVETLERLLASSNGGLSATQIADQAGASYPATLKLLRKLEASGQVLRSGERRSTSWRMITDEDRIAERAAELERAANAPGRRRGRARAS